MAGLVKVYDFSSKNDIDAAVLLFMLFKLLHVVQMVKPQEHWLRKVTITYIVVHTSLFN